MFCFPATPKAPSKIHTKGVRKDSVTLEWDAPVDDGGARLTGYVIEKRDTRKARWTYVHKVSTAFHVYRIPASVLVDTDIAHCL